jgi:hypothetical protein
MNRVRKLITPAVLSIEPALRVSYSTTCSTPSRSRSTRAMMRSLMWWILSSARMTTTSQTLL